jgi:hypothetical protein
MDAEGTKPRTRSSERVPRWPFGWQVLCGVSPDARKCFQSYHLAAVMAVWLASPLWCFPRRPQVFPILPLGSCLPLHAPPGVYGCAKSYPAAY